MIQTTVNFFMNIVELLMPLLKQTIKKSLDKLKNIILSREAANTSLK